MEQQAQPGDPYAAERAQMRREVQMFRTPEGVDAYAHRVWRRAVADLMFLATWRRLGHQQAGILVCERYGHDARGRICERCGAIGA